MSYYSNIRYSFSGKSLFATRMKKPKADQEDDAASSSDEENKDAPDVATTLSLD